MVPRWRCRTVALRHSAPRPRAALAPGASPRSDLSAGSYAFAATDTTSAGTSAASKAFDVTVTGSSPTTSAGSNLVANANFATGNFTDWTLGGNYADTTYGPEIFIDRDAEGGSTYAAGMGSVGSDGALSQTIATTALSDQMLAAPLTMVDLGHEQSVPIF